MTKQLLLLCVIVGDVLGSLSMDQSTFPGLASLEAELSSDPTWHDPPRWCGGHNYIRTLKFGRSNLAIWVNPFFTAVSMYCHYDDQAQGETEEEKIVAEMDAFNGRFNDDYLECRVPLDYEEDGIRQLTLYGQSWYGGFGLVEATCNSRSDSHVNVSSTHPDWPARAASAVAYPLVCPGKEVVVGIQATFTTKGLVAVKTWCGSVIYHEYMPSIDYTYGDVKTVGLYPPGQMFDSSTEKYSTQDAMMCPDGAYMSGYEIVSVPYIAFYSMIMHCTDGSDVSATRLIPEGMSGGTTYTRNCVTNNTRIPMKYMDVILDYEGNDYSFPGLEIGCVDGRIIEEHNSHFTWGFSDPFVFENLVCPGYHLAVGIIPVSTRLVHGNGITGIQLVCKEAPECEFF